ncbi:MAG: hypothetical protein P4M15_00610 [Alphaproteobacteria bacterium]|nr:hypothetical protein [Alphaproteobacteria bacterium]
MLTQKTLGDFDDHLFIDGPLRALDFLYDRRDIISVLDEMLEDHIVNEMNRERSPTIAMDDFHDDVLEFADFLTEREEPVYWACASQLAAYVLTHECLPERVPEAQNIFERVQAVLYRREKSPDFYRDGLEIFYAAARHFPVEKTSIGNFVHETTLFFIANYFDADNDRGCDFMVTAANSARKYPSGEGVLLMFAEGMGRSCREQAAGIGQNKDHVIKGLGEWAGLFSRIGSRLPKNSLLTQPMIDMLADVTDRVAAWDKVQAQKFIRDSVAICNQTREPNSIFSNFVTERAEGLSNPESYGPTRSPRHPGGNRLGERLSPPQPRG